MGTQLPQKNLEGIDPTQFLARRGQMAGWIKMPLGTEVNVNPGDVVLDKAAAPPWKGHSPLVFGLSIVTKRLDGWRRRLVRK